MNNEKIQAFEAALQADKEKLNQFLDVKKRIFENKEAASEAEALVKAAAELGFELPLEDVERAMASIAHLDEEELAGVAAGNSNWGKMKDALLDNLDDVKKSIEEVNWCWKDYNCVFIYKNAGF